MPVERTAVTNCPSKRVSRAEITRYCSSNSTLRVSQCPAPPPSGKRTRLGGRPCSADDGGDEPAEHRRQGAPDDDVEDGRVAVDELVLGAEQRAEADEEPVPDRAARDREHGEDAEMHARRSGGQRDETAHAGQEATEEHGALAVPVQPA